MINSYDIDGVINMGDYVGLQPGPNDIIITGRSVEEHDYTWEWLKKRNINNRVIFNCVDFKMKTRESSGEHKAKQH
jgi:hypothetical protein